MLIYIDSYERSKRGKLLRKAIVLILLCLAASACSGTSGSKTAPPTTIEQHVITGTMTLADTSSDAVLDLGGGACAGYDGYSDMEAGAGVVISDGTGKVVGNGQLEEGQKTSD